MGKALVTVGCALSARILLNTFWKRINGVSILVKLTTGHQINIDGLPIDFHEQDITKPKGINVIKSIDPDYIIHLAAQMNIAESVSVF